MGSQPLSESALKLALYCGKLETQLKLVSKQYQKSITSALLDIAKVSRNLADDLDRIIQPTSNGSALVSRISHGSQVERTLTQVIHICDATLSALWREIEGLDPGKKLSKLRRVSFGLMSSTRLSMSESQLRLVLGNLKYQENALKLLAEVLKLEPSLWDMQLHDFSELIQQIEKDAASITDKYPSAKPSLPLVDHKADVSGSTDANEKVLNGKIRSNGSHMNPEKQLPSVPQINGYSQTVCADAKFAQDEHKEAAVTNLINSEYAGRENIVISIDFGNTNTAVSFTHLYPGEKPTPVLVNRWPGQPQSTGDAKIPSVLAYQQGKLRACGSEALDFVDDEEYQIVKGFKLRLFEHLPPSEPNIETSPLPAGLTVTTIYADFLEYIFKGTHKFFTQRVLNGSVIWNRLEQARDIIFVISLPNEWSPTYQSILRHAILRAGLMTEKEVAKRLVFIPEGEALVHYALIREPSVASWLKPGTTFALMDAGGSTVDVTLYECKSVEPVLMLRKVSISGRIQTGGSYIDKALQELLEEKLAGSQFHEDGTIEVILTEFEERTKRTFDDTQPSVVIRFGHSSHNHPSVGISKGKLTLTQVEMRSVFDGVVNEIIKNCQELFHERNVDNLILVGGFGESPYLQKRLKNMFSVTGPHLVTTEYPMKNSVPDGLAITYIKQQVQGRVARFTLGTRVQRTFDSNRRSHSERPSAAYMEHGGVKKIDGAFSIWVEKGGFVRPNDKLTFSCYRLYQSIPDTMEPFTLQVYAYEGNERPDWLLSEDGSPRPGMHEFCTLTADLTPMKVLLRDRNPQTNNSRTTPYRLSFKVTVSLGANHIGARLLWHEGTRLRELPVEVQPQLAF